MDPIKDKLLADVAGLMQRVAGLTEQVALLQKTDHVHQVPDPAYDAAVGSPAKAKPKAKATKKK